MMNFIYLNIMKKKLLLRFHQDDLNGHLHLTSMAHQTQAPSVIESLDGRVEPAQIVRTWLLV